MSVDGTVRWVNRARGYGFITPNDGITPDIFVHFASVKGAPLIEGDQVKFRPVWHAYSGQLRAEHVTGGSGNPHTLEKNTGVGKQYSRGFGRKEIMEEILR